MAEQDEWLRQAAEAVRCILAGKPCQPPPTKVWKAVLLCWWARGCVWDTRDPEDCVPIELGVAHDSFRALAVNGAHAAFFEEWGRRLAWPDAEMLDQAGPSGVLSGAALEHDTVLMFHHGGLRQNAAPAADLVAKEEAAGWQLAGSYHLPMTPFRCVPWNCVNQPKWALDEAGALYEKDKWRVTTDDSIAAAESDARNDKIAREAWSDPNLCATQHLGEAVAILQTARQQLPATLREAAAQTTAAAAASGFELSRLAAERVALWAIDLSDAYRVLGVHWSELWHQGMVWSDGARVGLRCLFGTAHMVGFFQRVSLFVFAAAKALMAEYDAAIPSSAGVEAWRAGRIRLANIERLTGVRPGFPPAPPASPRWVASGVA